MKTTSKKRGIRLIDREQVFQMFDLGYEPNEIAEAVGCSTTSLNKIRNKEYIPARNIQKHQPVKTDWIYCKKMQQKVPNCRLVNCRFYPCWK